MKNKQMGLDFLEHPYTDIFLLKRIGEIINYYHYFKQSKTIKVTEIISVRYLLISFRNDKNMKIQFLFRIFLIYLYLFLNFKLFFFFLLYWSFYFYFKVSLYFIFKLFILYWSRAN